MSRVRALAQVLALSAAWLGADAAARALRSPVPGNVIGAIVLAVLLLTGVVPLRWVEHGADLLLRWLPLFFVPAAVIALRSWPLVRSDVAAIAAIMVGTLVLVLVITGALSSRWERR